MTINARIDVDQFKYDKKECIVKMVFSVLEEEEAPEAVAKGRRQSGIFLRVKRGLRNSTIVGKQQQFNTVSERHIGWTPMHDERFNEHKIQSKNFSSWAGANRLHTPNELAVQGENHEFLHSFEENSEVSSDAESKSVNLS